MGDRRWEMGDGRWEILNLSQKIRVLSIVKKIMNNQPAKTFQDLIVWQKAHQFVLSVYRLTQNFPSSETYGLTSQLRRASVSVPANIAESFKRKTLAEKIRFLNIAEASLEESRYYLILAKDLNYGNTEILLIDLNEVSKLLYSYSKTIETRNQKS